MFRSFRQCGNDNSMFDKHQESAGPASGGVSSRHSRSSGTLPHVDESKLFLLYLAGVPLLGAAAHWIAWRFRLPSILLLLGVGIALGRFIDPDRALARLAGSDESLAPKLLFPIVSLSVAVILFAGGLSLRLAELRETRRAVVQLCTLGAAAAWLLTWGAAQFLFDYDARIAALFGAMMVVTGPTVVIPLLRHIQPARRIGATLKWEGIVIDPIGAVLAVLVFQAISVTGDAAQGAILISLLKTFVVGILLGLGGAFLLAELVGRYWVPDHLHGIVFLTAALALFAASNIYQPESGLVTVTVAGVYLANQKRAPVRHVLEFKEHLVVLLIACLFIVLGSRLEPNDLLALGWRGAAFLAVLILAIRPASVFLATIGTELGWRERLFAAFVAPRGVVAAAMASVFALDVVHMAEVHPQAETLADFRDQARSLVPLAFLTIVGTVAVYGLAAGPLARRLGLAVVNPQGLLMAGARTWMREIALALQREGFAVVLVDTSFRNVVEARMAGLTAHCTSILSEYVQDELDLAGVGRMLALTPNDEVNSLACTECAHLFGRANVFQLPLQKAGDIGRHEPLSEHLRGRILFSQGAVYDELSRRFSAGHQVKTTKITREFTFAQFRERYGETALLLFLKNDSGELTIATAEKPLKPKPGDTLIALVKMVEESGAP
jgi:CPA1 family monovalent cation:H+ antiporter